MIFFKKKEKAKPQKPTPPPPSPRVLTAAGWKRLGAKSRESLQAPHPSQKK